jgi:uncharacterized phiE125 gp8 family phage protein
MILRRRTELVAAPAAEPITTAQAKAHLRVDHSDDDAYIAALIQACRVELEARSHRKLVEQTWDLKLSAFPDHDRIRLPFPPLRSVTSITYYDGDGASQTLSASIYRVHAPSGDLPTNAWIERVDGMSWPVTVTRDDAVTIRLVCGYAPAGTSPEDYGANIPGLFTAALKLMIAGLYDFRAPIITGTIVSANPAAGNLISLGSVPEMDGY